MSITPTAGPYAAVVQRLSDLIAAFMDERQLTGVSIVLVDDQTLVYAGGFGMADQKRGIPAGADTVYRPGSISKLFNALAVMQLAERGVLDLDAPITRYVPDFSIVVPFIDAEPITLRQLLCHRSGLIRESPVGSYFDDAEPTVEAAVRSLANCVLVRPPNTQTRYSNIGAAIAGHVVARASAMEYEAYQQSRLLGPMGMNRSTFRTKAAHARGTASGYLPIAQPGGGFRRELAPGFELATIPAGNLYAPVTDLARLAMMIFAEGRSGGGQIVRPETLREMLRPQLTESATGFGLGFNITRFGEWIMASHNGAIYGFSSSFATLPEAKLAAIVLANEDLVLGPVKGITETALELMLELKQGRPTVAPPPLAMPPAELDRFSGEYESESYWARLSIESGPVAAAPRLTALVSGQALSLVPIEPRKFRADGRWQWHAEFAFTEGADGSIESFQALGQTFCRVQPDAAAIPPAEWQAFLGSYGPWYAPLLVSIRNGHLYAFTENLCDYRLKPLCRTVFSMPPGLYTDEQLVFQLGSDGRAHSAILASVELKRST